MKILFDQGVPVPLRKSLLDHQVVTAYELGWSTLKNGELLAAAVAQEFEVMVTTDQNLEHQQKIAILQLAIIVLPTTAWPTLSKHVDKIAETINNCQLGKVLRVEF
ncbi:DUF5615 family PIN-like protein [Aeoliella mucimassa]|uniref:DUF5615 domain-containing protein n=1 Tax=Aeoliella mucimassa TaxID=2527972 RepID=A0A518AI94_9BACT|nr:DUF5615 family PIN-like protein [Aeoliella mucimassa]QDU54448.1 hypothetical protein Pan181_06300 [Aeoliella mucimassa]